MAIVKGLSFLSGRVGYSPVPKVACTSIKRFFYELEEKREFNRENVGCDVHQYYKSRFVDISSCERRILIIRDPFKRFCSGWYNRVHQKKELSYDFIRSKNKNIINKIPIFNPSLNEFIEYLDVYLMMNVISHHINPVNETININDFTDIFKFENLDNFERLISEIANTSFSLPHTQIGQKSKEYNISNENLEKLKIFLKSDYAMLKEFYDESALGPQSPYL